MSHVIDIRTRSLEQLDQMHRELIGLGMDLKLRYLQDMALLCRNDRKLASVQLNGDPALIVHDFELLVSLGLGLTKWVAYKGTVTGSFLDGHRFQIEVHPFHEWFSANYHDAHLFVRVQQLMPVSDMDGDINLGAIRVAWPLSLRMIEFREDGGMISISKKLKNTATCVKVRTVASS